MRRTAVLLAAIVAVPLGAQGPGGRPGAAGWRRGVSHLDLLSPRVRSLEALMLAWSPGTNGRPVDADVITIPELADSNAAAEWLRTVKGKAVLTTAPQLSCRSPQQVAEFATPETQARIAKDQDALTASWRARLATFGTAPAAIQQKLKDAGAVAVLANNWSRWPGIDKIFGSWRQLLPTFDVSCEDYGLLSRLAEHGQKPRVRMTAESEFLGEKPVFNTIAEIRGTEKPDEYVMLSAHFDSWDWSSGATDNATCTTLMM
ncbi:MAG: M28 family peptidase, partial [Gemmatimonadetes bacterium]|nr:M28 family peptidase [Gemmatimonadota bacterium]